MAPSLRCGPPIMNLLIVDDDPLVTRSLFRWLSSRGFVVTTACDARSSRAAAGPFDFAIVDLRLEGSPECGIMVAEELLGEGRAMRVVFFTGAPEAAGPRARALGRVVSKGRLGELLEAVTAAA